MSAAFPGHGVVGPSLAEQRPVQNPSEGLIDSEEFLSPTLERAAAINILE
jgi:hypothetical protein